MTRPVTRHVVRRIPIVLLLALALLAGACAHGGSGSAGAPPSRDDHTQGGPTTSTTTGSGSGTGPDSGSGSDPGPGSSPVAEGIRIEVESSQPDRLTGDDARVRVTPRRGQSVADLRVLRDGVDVTRSLQPKDGALEGVVHGFVEGDNTVTAKAGRDSSTQRIRAWPKAGPMISGPHLPLLACSTAEHGLGPPTDADCSAPTKVTWRYLDAAHHLHPLTSTAAAPADIATARIGGVDVPLYVRYERGVINRSVYEIASIDATPGNDDPVGPGWNGKLLYRYGGGCGTTYGQGTALTTALDPTYLAKGYALATATFNTFQVQCNDVLSAETTMMVKERVIEEFGRPTFTIGEGASGGSIQLHLMVQNYPGLVDGVVAELPFPDAVSVSSGVSDCGLLLSYFESAGGKLLTDAQRRAIDGHASSTTCQTWKDTFLGGIDPTDGCDPKIPASKIYDATNNSGGIRCTLQDANVNQFGRDVKTGFAERPLDNIGVQYGLDALNAGVISPAQFLDLNDAIGGYTIDGGIQRQREEADPAVVEHAYETGRIALGGGDMLSVPIIDINVFTDPSGDIHDRFRAFSLRDRLTRGGGPEAAPGFQIWTRDPGQISLSEALGNEADGGGDGPAAVAVVDRWLTAMRRDTAGGSPAARLLRNRPADAVDNCSVRGTPDLLRGVGIYERSGPCRDRFAISGDPRTAAGAPRRDDIIKCRLKPVDLRDYDVTFSEGEKQVLNGVFASGVCDYSQLGVGETVPVMPDRSYDDVEGPAQRA